MAETEGVGVMHQMMAYDNVTVYYVEESTMATTAMGEDWSDSAYKPSVSVIILILYIFIFILAVVGNSLVVATLILNKRMRSAMTVFLVSISVSDLLFICVCPPFTFVGLVLRNFIFGKFMCKLVSYTMAVSVAVSVWTMVAIALERYQAICNPLASRAWQTKSRAFKIVALIWVAACIFGLPDLIFSRLLLYDPVNMKYKCRTVWAPAYLHQFYTVFALMILPLICLFFAYGLIVLELCRGISSEKRSTGKATDSKAIYRPQSGKVATRNTGPVPSTLSHNAKKRVIGRLIVLVLLFFISWGPTWMWSVWSVVNRQAQREFELKIGLGPRLFLVIQLMSYASACVNPIVYCFISRSFRNGFLEVFKCCTRRRPVKDDTKPTV